MDKSTRDFLLFLAKLLLIWFSWKVFILIIGVESTPINERYFPALSLKWEIFNSWYKLHLLETCSLLLNGLGYSAWLDDIDHICIDNRGGVGVGHYCLAFQLMYYFSMLIVVSEIRWTQKALGILIGFVIVNVLNIIRISALAVISAYYYRLSYFFHDYVFNIVVFGTLMIYYYWMVRTRDEPLQPV